MGDLPTLPTTWIVRPGVFGRMPIMPWTRSRPAFLAGLILLAGCESPRPTTGRTFDPSPVHHGFTDWGPPPGAEKGSVPGTDFATVHHVTWKRSIVFAIWVDLPPSRSWGYAPVVDGQTGWFHDPPFPKVEYDFRMRPEAVSQVTINGQRFGLDQGWLFLVSVRGGAVRVKQLNRDVLSAPTPHGRPEVFAALKADPEVVGFFARTKGPV
jgi:hypothetical protein